MSINIYVGNLPWSVNDQELGEAFADYGRVDSAKVIMDRETGRSRGFGFVEMADREEGLNAIKELDGREVLGRALKVNEARPRQNRPERRDFRDNRGGRNDGRREFRYPGSR